MSAAAAPALGSLEALAALLDYPGEDLARRAEAAREAMRREHGRAARALDAFVETVRTMPLVDLEEVYTRTFDWSPERCLEVGWHLFGEAYDRGAFLVRARGLLREAGVEEGTNLPDHLPCLLRALARLPVERTAEVAADSVRPALEKMRKGQAAHPGPWTPVLEAVALALAATPPAPGAR